MSRGRALALGLAMSAVMLYLAPGEAMPAPKIFQCTGDAYVTNYNFGDPINDATGSFYIENSSLFCHDEDGKSGYTGTVQVRWGTIQGSGWCVDPTTTEPGNIRVSAIVEINITHEATGIVARNVSQRWKLIRTITGKSDAPIPGGTIRGYVHPPGSVGKASTFLIQPMGTPNDCYHQFETIRFYNLLAVLAPGA